MTAAGCPCETFPDPHAVFNRPGLATIAYRVDDFAGFRRALLQPQPGEQALLGWHPAPGDLGLQLLEWWAYLADILTFYNERVANEDYLRTAELPANVAGLVALLGYSPRPAIGAVGQIAAVRSAARPNEPLVVPAGMQIASTATPGVPVETFEAAAATFQGPSDAGIVLEPSAALLQASGTGVGSVLLQGSVAGIKAGDELIALPRDVAAAEESWAVVTVAATATETDPNGGSNTRVTLEARDSFAAAELATYTAAGSRLARWSQTAALWNQTSDAAISDLPTGELQVRLSAVVRGISTGDLVFVDDGEGGFALGPVTQTSDEYLSVPYPDPGITPPPPNIPILHTVLRIEQPRPLLLGGAGFLRRAPSLTLRFGLKDAGTPIGSPAPTLEALPASARATSPIAIPAGGTAALVEDATGAGIAVTVTSAADGTLALARSDATAETVALTAPFRLFVDLVAVSRGKTVANETLGTGDAGVGGQTFMLAKAPLTYLAKGAGRASALAVAVDGIYWTEVDTFYEQPPGARVFVVSQGADGKSSVRFGDGVNGARLPTGSRVVATYRYGAGVASPPAGRLTTILKPQPNLASVRNPVAVWGGADAQPPGDVRKNAPTSVLTFGRAISADDYEAVAALAPGVSRARAYWTWDADHQRSLVKVYVGDDASAATSARSALEGADDPNRPVAVAQAVPIDLTLACTLEIAPDRVAEDVVAAATASLTDPDIGLFAAAQMQIGRPLYSSELEAALLVNGAGAVHGLSLMAGGAEVFTSEPVGWADPGEGGFFVLTESTITPVVADG
jgi:hypothetical protein